MLPDILTFAGIVVSSGALFSFIQFLITRHDLRKGWTAQNIDRLQLMLLIADYPRKVDEILKLAEHYFVKLHGNSFLRELFADWLETQHIQAPEWFNNGKEEK